jgi:uncharacterized protein YhbP (UPF0306 family)
VAAEPLFARLAVFLAGQSTLTLATVAEDGRPLAAALFFVADEALNLYFVSGANSRHAQAIARDRRVAATVYASTWDWPSIAGLQLEGEARALSGAEREAALALYAGKFPFVAGMAARLAESTCYRITPRWLRWIDNRQGFGHREEWPVTAAT